MQRLGAICRALIPVVRPSAVKPFNAFFRPARLASQASLPKSWVPDAPSTPNPVQQIHLREYQEECIQSVLASVQTGHKRLGISLATGAGKTIIFTQLIGRVASRDEAGTQTLILAHRRELVEQAARHCTNAYPGLRVEIEMGNMHASGTADITIASVQSIASGNRVEKFDPRRFKLVLVDEAHHIVAPNYLRTLEHFGLDAKREDSPVLVGVSATFSRADGLRLGSAIDEIVYHKDYVDMIGEKWLSDVIFTTVRSTADLSRVRGGANGDFSTNELSEAVNTDEINEIAVRSWLAKAAGRKSTLVFCVDLAHVRDLTQAFRAHGVTTKFVTGNTPKVERGEILGAFKRGEFPVLVNCGVFTEGTDIPNIDCVLLARPTRSRNLLVQMIGRGMRLHPGKDNCHIIDMVSSLDTGIVSTPTLFGLDPSEVLDDASMDELNRRKEQIQQKDTSPLGERPAELSPHPSGRQPKVTFTEYESVFDLINDSSGERHIRAISRNAWVQVNRDKFVLCGPDKSFLKLEKNNAVEGDAPMWSAWETRALPRHVKSKSPYATPRQILDATTFTDAVHGADRYAAEIFPHIFISRGEQWRKKPATAGQVKFLNKIRGDNGLEPGDLTIGHAGDMITKIKHGARGFFTVLEAERRKRERLALSAQKVKERRLKETVSVGPVAAWQ